MLGNNDHGIVSLEHLSYRYGVLMLYGIFLLRVAVPSGGTEHVPS